MKITIVNFSGRKNGNCHAISKVIADVHSAEGKHVFNFCDINFVPCGKCEYECFSPDKQCQYQSDGVYDMYDRITKSDLTYFIVPNYCDYPNANYFIFNERSQCFFQHHEELLDRYLSVKKRFIVVSNTQTQNFIAALSYQIPEGESPDILFLPAKAYKKISIDGDLMTSPEAKKAVEAFCQK